MARWMAADLYWKEVDLLRSELFLKQASKDLLCVWEMFESRIELLADGMDKLDRTRTWAVRDE